ncbi:MAG: hypothetical protein ACK5LY_07455 [Lachnospirales bacterium]
MEKFLKYLTAFEVITLVALIFNKKLSFLNFNIVVVTKGNYVVTQDGTPIEVSTEDAKIVKR